jgi:hypothetical protein
MKNNGNDSSISIKLITRAITLMVWTSSFLTSNRERPPITGKKVRVLNNGTDMLIPVINVLGKGAQ